MIACEMLIVAAVGFAFVLVLGIGEFVIENFCRNEVEDDDED